ncbi:MAG: L-aspartate oxidase [Candidatus Delongbacteria bacterium]|nr:L-aspartate oxidase [Candidatus Delongbacteria bacterium]
MIRCDILVIGTGLAGCTAAITAAEQGQNVLMITKTPDMMSGNTCHAQGGIIYQGPSGNPELLIQDIRQAGDGICYEPAVRQLAVQGPDLVKHFLIDRLNVDFDRTPSGDLDLTMEGAHSEARIIHHKDSTGYSIHQSVLECARTHPGIKILTDHTAIDLLTLSHHSRELKDIYQKPACFGIQVLNNLSGDVYPILARKTILATGGIGRLYLHSSNPREATGDGIALAWRAGARCFNLQYVQFHPTTLYVDKERFLISESLRGEGARLITHEGKSFMERFHAMKELAPRDVVARAIYQTMLDLDHACVYLDISHKDADWIKNRFPSIYTTCLESGINITTQPIPVVPAAHYFCGGVGINLNGRTSLRRLYAVGEVACSGLHGANRLASTSLLECVVWGHRAGMDAAADQESDNYFPPIYDWIYETEDMDPALIAQDWLTIKNTMWNYVGLIRTPQRLNRARTILRHLQSEIEIFYKKVKLSRSIIQLRNGIQTAIAITQATLEARQNRGAHFLQSEFPASNP